MWFQLYSSDGGKKTLLFTLLCLLEGGVSMCSCFQQLEDNSTFNFQLRVDAAHFQPIVLHARRPSSELVRSRQRPFAPRPPATRLHRGGGGIPVRR